MSTVGGGGGGNDEGDDGEYDPLNEWIRRGGGGGAPGGTNDDGGRRLGEEARAEGRLPISYGAVGAGGGGGANGGRFGPMSSSGDPAATDGDAPPSSSSSSSSSSLSPPSPASSSSSSSRNNNPYLAMVTRLAPSDLISRFTSTAPPRVQDAVRSTILGLVGGMASQMKFDTRAVATGEKLANLMFQLQMTGYMFKNAEYRLGLSQSLGVGGASSSSSSSSDGGGGGRMLPAGKEEGGGNGDDGSDAMRRGRLVDGSRIKVRYGGGVAGGDDDDVDVDVGEGGSKDDGPSSSVASSGIEVEVDARAYMSELRREVRRLRDELEATKLAREEETRKDLLGYIRSLPKGELQRLTGTMSPEVLEAMKGLVSAVLSGIGEEGEGEEEEDEGGGGDVEGKMIGPDTVTEQSGEALAQLCMWQLVVGYNLRELEVREEFRASMMMADDDDIGANNEKFGGGGGDDGGGGGGGGPGDGDGGGAVAAGDDGRDEWR